MDNIRLKISEKEKNNNDVNEGLRKRLLRYYKHHCPDKLDNIETIIKKYKNQEKALFKSLVSKYGPEPPASEIEKQAIKNRIDKQRNDIKAKKVVPTKKDIFDGHDLPVIFDEKTQILLDKLENLKGKNISDELLSQI